MSSADWDESSTDSQTGGFENIEPPQSLPTEVKIGNTVDDEQPSLATESEPIACQGILKLRTYRLKK